MTLPVLLPRRRLLGAAASSATLMLHPPSASAAQARFAIGESDFLLDGKPLQIRCGEMHFARVPREYWKHRLQAVKAMA
jgi:beta-galactosidase